MKALISPNEGPEGFARVAEVSNITFEIALPLYWVDCPIGTKADMLFHNGIFSEREDTPSTELPHITVSPWELRKALNLLGIREAVEEAVASSSQTVKDGWEFAGEFNYSDPLVHALGTSLGKTSEELYSIFVLAKTL